MKTTPNKKTPPAATTQDVLASESNENLNRGTKAAKEFRRAVNTKEACEMLGGISPRSLARLEKRGLIRSSKALRTKLFSIAEIERFLEETL